VDVTGWMSPANAKIGTEPETLSSQRRADEDATGPAPTRRRAPPIFGAADHNLDRR